MESGQCTAKNRQTGKRCGKRAMNGITVCFQHGGKLPSVRKKAAVRSTIAAWGLDCPDVDPGEAMLRLVSQSAARVTHYGSEVAEMVAEAPNLRVALTASVWRCEPDADEDAVRTYKAGEYIRAMVELESEERDRLAKFCKIAIDAGLREREIDLAERQGAMLAVVLSKVLGDERLGLTEAQRSLALDVIDVHAGQLAGTGPAAPAYTGPSRKRGAGKIS